MSRRVIESEREARLQLILARCALDRAELRLAAEEMRMSVGGVRRLVSTPRGLFSTLGTLWRAVAALRGGNSSLGVWALPVVTAGVRYAFQRGPVARAVAVAVALGTAAYGYRKWIGRR